MSRIALSPLATAAAFVFQNVAFLSYVFMFVDYKKTWPKLFDFSQYVHSRVSPTNVNNLTLVTFTLLRNRYEYERVSRYLSLLFSLTVKMALDEWVYSISAMIAAFIGPIPVVRG